MSISSRNIYLPYARAVSDTTCATGARPSVRKTEHVDKHASAHTRPGSVLRRFGRRRFIDATSAGVMVFIRSFLLPVSPLSTASTGTRRYTRHISRASQGKSSSSFIASRDTAVNVHSRASYYLLIMGVGRAKNTILRV